MEAQSSVDVTTAEAALSQHSLIKKSIFSVPVERLQSESERFSERINRAECGTSNPDLISSIPHMVNLLTSLQGFENDVFKQWENRRVELEGCYQMKLFGHDAEEVVLSLATTFSFLYCRCLSGLENIVMLYHAEWVTSALVRQKLQTNFMSSKTSPRL
ncbi:unnamed protein product [Cylicocyclus nassatus]|uniref:Uncharacterized protein n=1 Tax=Cylicocyclus nassatus TaxID=53992 RepID=A0AA36DMN8_CYLNA|nr:unnamed protein product [Cylicocyclus nassatus]